MKKLYLNVTEHKLVYLVISLVFVICAVCLVVFHGFALGVDFEGGLAVTVKIEKEGVKIDGVRRAVESIEDVRVQNLGSSDNGIYQIRYAMSASADRIAAQNVVSTLLNNAFGRNNVQILQSDFIGAKFSSSIITSSIKAVGIALVLILIYVWIRFRAAYAICSIIALSHDVILMFGLISACSFELTSTAIAAVLTIIGYSLNNTIVIFDRVRSIIDDNNKQKLSSIINNAVTDSLRRTTYSSITTILAVVPLAILATGDVRNFALCMIWGVVCGTWSSNFVATSLLHIIGGAGSMDIRVQRKKDEVDFNTPGPKILV